MAKRTFRVLTLSFIDDRLRQPGDIVLFEERDAGANLERVDAGKAPAESGVGSEEKGVEA